MLAANAVAYLAGPAARFRRRLDAFERKLAAKFEASSPGCFGLFARESRAAAKCGSTRSDLREREFEVPGRHYRSWDLQFASTVAQTVMPEKIVPDGPTLRMVASNR
jgi:hypothetical protein